LFKLPSELPDRLLQQLKAVRDDENLIKMLLHRIPSFVAGGDPFHLLLQETWDILEVKGYYIVQKLWPDRLQSGDRALKERYRPMSHCALIARGDRLPEPVLLARVGGIRDMTFKLWRGKESGFDEESVVKRRPRLEYEAYVVDGVDNDQNDDGQSILSIPSQSEEDALETNQPNHTRNDTVTIPDSGDAAVKKEVHSSIGREIIDITDEPIELENASAPTSPGNSQPLNEHTAVFAFIDYQGKVVRQRPLSKSSPAARFYGHIRASRILRDQSHGTISAQVTDGVEIMMVQDDEDDFDLLIDAMKQHASVKREGDGDFVVQVRAV
jgi:hypothetical protein